MTANADDSPSTHPFGNLMIGRILVDRRVMADDQVEDCLRQQQEETRSRGRRRALGVIVVERGFAKPEQVEAALAFQRQQFANQVVGPYRLAEKIGEGGSSVVYRAIAVDGGRAVALKILPQNAPGDVAAIARFQKEAQAGMSLQHAHIVKTLDWGTHRDAYWLAMELMPGGTLLQRVRQEGPLNESAALELACGMLDALRLAGERGMVHRDIKPTNILFDARGRGKLADLGLAQLIASPNDLGPGKLVGTPAYIAPEQALGQGGVDARSDLYSLGATLFHALTGGPPFVEPSAIDLANHHLNTAPPSADDINPEVSAGTAAVVRKLLAKRQGDRYATASEALTDVRRVIEGRAPVALSLSAAKAFAPLDVRLRIDQPATNSQRQTKGKGKSATPASMHFDVVAEPSKPGARAARKPETGSQKRGAKPRPGAKLRTDNPITLVIAAAVGVVIAAAGGGTAWWWANRKPPAPTVAATPVTDVPTVSKAVRTVDLLGTIDGRKLNPDDWAKRDGVLVSTRGARRLLPLSQPAPREYDLMCTFKRLNPAGSLVLVLDVGGHPVCWMVGGDGEPRAGLDEVLGKGLDTNGTSRPLPLGLDPDKRHTTVVQVRKDGLTCRVDGRELLVHPTSGSDLSVDAKWELPEKATLGIGSAGTQVAIYRLELAEYAEVAASSTPVPASPPSP